MSTFEYRVEVAKAELERAKKQLKLYQYGLSINLGNDNAERLANGTLFGANTAYRAKGHPEFTNEEASKIDSLLNDIYKNE